MRKNYLKTTILSAFILLAAVANSDGETPTPKSSSFGKLPARYKSLNASSDKVFVLPFGYNNKSKEELNCFFENFNEERLDKLTQNYRVGVYLKELGLLSDIEKDMCEGDIYIELDLTKYLSKEQLVDFECYISNPQFVIEHKFNAGGAVCSEWVSDGWETVCFTTLFGVCVNGKECRKMKRTCGIPGSSWHWTEYQLKDCYYFPDFGDVP